MSYEIDLTGLRCLVTGAGSGIGAAIAVAMCQAGAAVVGADRDPTAEIAVTGAGAEFCLLDVGDHLAVAAAIKRTGPFDILVNNAGMNQHAFFTATTYDDWRTLIAVNLESVLATTLAVLPGMQEKRYGRIVNIASEAGRKGSKGGAVYAAAKAGVIGFTKSIARENARFGITVNAICPGPISTPLLEQVAATTGGRMRETLIAQTLVNRLGEPEEVASTAVYLASSLAGFITGEAIGVSGGMGV